MFACNTSSTDYEVEWWRFADASVLDTFLEDDDKLEFEMHRVETKEGIFIVSGDSLELIFTAARHEIVGYYATTLKLSGQHVFVQTFIVYSESGMVHVYVHLGSGV